MNTINRKHSSLADRVSYLIKKEGIYEAEFARKTGIKQQLCNQILRGQTENPRLETLTKLASFFNVTVGQLIGTESLERSPYGFQVSAVPLLEWNHVTDWVEKAKLPESDNNSGAFIWMSSDLPSERRGYAIRSNPILEPYFDRNAILLVDPSLEYQAGHFIVASLKSSTSPGSKTITVRRLVEELGDKFLNSIVPGIPSIQVNTQVQLLGTVVEVRQSQIRPQLSIRKGKEV
jgi:transcriptional regulator with XRE-family HTH domain